MERELNCNICNLAFGELFTKGKKEYKCTYVCDNTCQRCYNRKRRIFKNSLKEPKVKPLECSCCERSFTVVGYYAKSMCATCYRWKSKRYTLTTQISENCKGCNVKFDENIKRCGRSRCRKCYNDLFSAISSKKCKKCGVSLVNRTITSLCGVCKLDGTGTNNLIIDKHTLESIRRLLVRYKFGRSTYVDNYVVCSLYVDIMHGNNPLPNSPTDQMFVDDQIIHMLKQLKLIYEEHRKSI